MKKLFLGAILLLILGACVPWTPPVALTPLPPPPKAYFDDKIQPQLLEAIEQATNKINIAVFDLSDQEIIGALKNRRAKELRIIIDQKYHSYLKDEFNEGKEWRRLNGRSKGTKGGMMHNKFCIIDDTLIVTGSYNFSENADRKNHENMVFIYDLKVIQQYQEEFERLWKEVADKKLSGN